MDGQIYFLNIRTETIDGEQYAILPKKGSRAKQVIPFHYFNIVKEENLSNYLKEHNIDLSAPEDDKILIQKSDGTYAQLGMGPFTMEARKEILRKLLETQKSLKHPTDPKFELIQEEELRVIRTYWLENGDWEDSLPKIFFEIIGEHLDWDYDDRPMFTEDQITDLELICQQNGIDFKLIKKLIAVEKNYAGYKVKRGIYDEIEKILTQDYLHI